MISSISWFRVFLLLELLDVLDVLDRLDVDDCDEEEGDFLLRPPFFSFAFLLSLGGLSLLDDDDVLDRLDLDDRDDLLDFDVFFLRSRLDVE